MKSILKKTLGVLTILLVGPLAAVIMNYLISVNPNPVEAIKHGLIIDLIIIIGFIFGWYVSKFVSWCFNKD